MRYCVINRAQVEKCAGDMNLSLLRSRRACPHCAGQWAVFAVLQPLLGISVPASSGPQISSNFGACRRLCTDLQGQ